MKRMHLFELEDQSWFPENIRNFGTDFLQFMSNRLNVYKKIIPHIVKGIRKSNTTQVIDIASGGGGGWQKLSQQLIQEVPELTVVLTDKFPNLDAFQLMKKHHPAVFEYRNESVDALKVPNNLQGLRTHFLSFHHFKPEEAQSILQNAVDARSPILIAEAGERNLLHLLLVFLVPILVLLTTPFIRPFKPGRLLFTYLIPLVPLFVLWDGFVSVFRIYSIKELQSMTEGLNHSSSFVWEIGKHRNGPHSIIYLLGYPDSPNFQ